MCAGQFIRPRSLLVGPDLQKPPGDGYHHQEEEDPDRALKRLEEASKRDWVFDAERRERALEEAEKELWMTRAEYLREMIE